MSESHFLAQRLYSHHLNDPSFETAADVVRWYGAVQAQEYLDTKAVATPAELPFPSPSAHLLATYDEYTVAYKDRRVLQDPAYADKADKSTFWWAYLLDGRVAGMWRRVFKKDEIVIESDLRPLSEGERAAIEGAAARYGRFYGLPVVMSWNELTIRSTGTR